MQGPHTHPDRTLKGSCCKSPCQMLHEKKINPSLLHLVLLHEWFSVGIILHRSHTPNCTTGTQEQADSCLQCADTAESTNATIKAYKINMFCNFLSTCAWCGNCILKATREENWPYPLSGTFTRSEREPLFSSELRFHSQKSFLLAPSSSSREEKLGPRGD